LSLILSRTLPAAAPLQCLTMRGHFSYTVLVVSFISPCFVEKALCRKVVLHSKYELIIRIHNAEAHYFIIILKVYLITIYLRYIDSCVIIL
jgi:hypothetical protein